MKKLFVLLFITCLSQTVTGQEQVSSKDVEELAARLEGSFTSADQAAGDPSYKEIALRMKQIWPKQKKGIWLYVEEALGSSLQSPYRQRLYFISKQDNQTLAAKVYQLTEPLRFVGACDDPSMLAELTMDSLTELTGCAIYFRKTEKGDFYGNIPASGCADDLQGAAYTTSELIVYPSTLSVWDRGWSTARRQVWGPEKAGYWFTKQEILPVKKKKSRKE